MTPAARYAQWIAIGACVCWALATFGTLSFTLARVEFAQAAFEARAVVRARTTAPAVLASPRRRIVADGSILRASRELSRYLAHPVRDLAAEDRVVIHRAWLKRAVSVPIKDRDEWDIVGVIALEATPWADLALPFGAVAGACLLAAMLARAGIARLAQDHRASVYAAMVAPTAILAVVMAVLTVMVRQRIDAAVDLLPPSGALSRVDATSLPLPSGALAGIALAVVLGSATTVLFAAGWAASARRRPSDRRTTLTAWAFLAPSALHLVVFTAAPLLFTLFISFHDWDLLRTNHPFVGLGNYVELARDPLFWRSLLNTTAYALYVPVSMGLALGAALILNQPLRGMRVLRTLVVLPTVVSYVAIAIVWQWMFNLDFGLLNVVLRAAHLPAVDWLGNPKTALVAVMIASAWVQLGYQMVIYLAGLQGIPAQLYEAATIDGASAWNRFRHITLPLLRPVSVFLALSGVVWSFQAFTLVYVMTEGGPLHATDLLVYRIYQTAWEFRRMGYASAMSWALFAILLGLTLLQWRTLNRTVDDA